MQGESVYSLHAVSRQPDRVFWAGAHTHTSISVYAYADGSRAIGPDEAYRDSPEL